MRTIGIDLAIKGEHKAVVVDEAGNFLTPVLKCHSRADELAAMLATARQGATEGALQAVLEPTGMAWFPVAAYLTRQDVTVYLVNSQQVADLRRFYKRHAKSDRIDARVLAKLPLVNGDQLHRLQLSPAPVLACQRACRQRDRVVTQITATRNRILASDSFAWPGLRSTVFPKPFSPAARWFRQHWYDPGQVLQAGASALRQQWCASADAADNDGSWAEALVTLAEQVLALYGTDGICLDFGRLQREVCGEQERLAQWEAEERHLRWHVVRPLYRQIHPSRHLETLPGVGEDGAAVYASFMGVVERFPSARACRGWSGLVPNSKQSASQESKGLHITQAGPNLIKKFAYLDAEVARLHDPQIAAIYYDQMVHKGKHYNQAICACATHLLDRVRTVLREDKPYELRDVDGQPVTPEQARAIIAERYIVPDEVRQRNTKQQRRQRTDQHAERQTQRESRPS